LLFLPPGGQQLHFFGSLDRLYRYIFYAVCHPGHLARPALWHNPFPLCYRETGIFIGFLVGLTLLAELHPHRPSELPQRRVLAFIGLAFALLAADGVASYAGIGSTNETRLATGLLVGFGLSALILPSLNAALFRRPSLERLLQERRPLALWLLAPPVAFAAIWYHPLGVGYVMPHLAAAAVVLLIATVNLFGLSKVRLYAAAEESVMEVMPWLLASVGLALAELALLAAGHSLIHG